MRRLAAVVATLVVVGFAVFTPPSKGTAHAAPPKPTVTVTTTVTQTITQTVTATVTETVTVTPPPVPVPANVRIAVMLVHFAGDTAEPWTPAFIDSLFDGPAPSTADFYAQSSWGQLTVTSDTFGWFNTTATGCQITTMENQADAAATASGVDLSTYTHRAYVFHNTACSFTGNAGINWNTARYNLNPSTCSMTSCPPGARNQFFHELGHNLGLNHAASYICTEGGVHVVYSATCTTNQYGDQFDSMGCCATRMMSNLNRLRLGWIPMSQVVTVDTTSTLTVTGAYNQNSLVYRVPLGDGTYLYLENRRQSVPIYDLTSSSSWPNGNLLIRRFGPLNDPYPFTQLLDGSPGDNDSIPNAKALPIGAGFTANGVTITNQAFDGTNNTVGVTIG